MSRALLLYVTRSCRFDVALVAAGTTTDPLAGVTPAWIRGTRSELVLPTSSHWPICCPTQGCPAASPKFCKTSFLCSRSQDLRWTTVLAVASPPRG